MSLMADALEFVCFGRGSSPMRNNLFQPFATIFFISQLCLCNVFGSLLQIIKRKFALCVGQKEKERERVSCVNAIVCYDKVG